MTRHNAFHQELRDDAPYLYGKSSRSRCASSFVFLRVVGFARSGAGRVVLLEARAGIVTPARIVVALGEQTVSLDGAVLATFKDEDEIDGMAVGPARIRYADGRVETFRDAWLAKRDVLHLGVDFEEA